MTTKTTGKRESIVLVDGFGLIFRAYFALPPSMSTTSGEQTNAVYGFASMLLDVLRSRKPTYAVIALEGGHTFRHELYADYKGTRNETPPDLIEQIGRVQQLIATLGIPVKQVDRYEADDVIGSLSRTLADDGYDVIVVTGDSDLLQLVDDHILVVLPGARRFGDVREYDPRCRGRTVRLWPGVRARLQGAGRRHVGQHSWRSWHWRKDGESPDLHVRIDREHPRQPRGNHPNPGPECPG